MNTTDWPARRCSGDCHQGRRECTTPQACELPEVESMNHYWMIQRRVIALTIAAAVAAVMLALFGA